MLEIGGGMTCMAGVAVSIVSAGISDVWFLVHGFLSVYGLTSVSLR